MPVCLDRDVVRKQIVVFFEQTDNDSISFGELRKIKGAHGDFNMKDPCTNIIIAFSFSQPFLLAIEALLLDKVIKKQHTSALTYLVDGELPTIPIAKSYRWYKTSRWYPLALGRGKNFQKELKRLEMEMDNDKN